MKRTILVMMGALAVMGALYAQHASLRTAGGGVNPAFAWAQTSYDFGKIEQGIPVSHEFIFTNTGESALVITSVTTPCGCTVTEYTKSLIQPGESGFVKATYNAAKPGSFVKSITVHANTNGEAVQLTIKGEVVNANGTL